ncbi:MAG: hypothetical protein KF829_07040 [Ferruginibacter sp.]|nr:hypothetical protein [Ferruginibacter sp.]
MKITSVSDLDNAILALSHKKVMQEALIKEQWEITKDSFKPTNILQKSFEKLSLTTDVSEGLTRSIAGAGLGLLSQYLVKNKKHSRIKSILFSTLEKGIASGIQENRLFIKAYAKALYKNLFRRKVSR